MMNTIARTAKFMTLFSKADHTHPTTNKLALKDILVKVFKYYIFFVEICLTKLKHFPSVKRVKFKYLEVEK